MGRRRLFHVRGDCMDLIRNYFTQVETIENVEILDIKMKLDEMNEVAKKADNVSENWENDPENEELEKEFDRLYAQEWNIRQEIAKKVVKLTGIEYKIAFKMTYIPKFIDIINRKEVN